MNRINAQTRVIAMLMPNTNASGEEACGSCWVSVDEIEWQMGYDSLSSVLVIKAEVDRVVV